MKIVLAGYYGFENVGDELLLQAVLDGIRLRLPEARPIVLSNVPKATAVAHNVKSISRWDPFSILISVWGADRLMFGGGGIFQDRTSKRSLIYYTGLVLLARLLGTPVVLCAVGVDALGRVGSRQMLQFALGRRSVAIGVRDSASVAALEDVGIFQGIGLFSDLVFSLEAPAVAPGRGAALVVRDGQDPNQNAMFGWISRLLSDRGLSIDAMSFQPGADAQAAVAGGGPVAPFVSFRDAPARIAAAGVVVSARFHALVLAALAGRPFMGIGEPSSKIHSLCRQLVMPFVPWDATRQQRDLAAEKLFTAAAPDARRVGALRRRAGEALDDALGIL